MDGGLEGYCWGRKLGLWSKVSSFVSNGLGSIDAWCFVKKI